MSARLRRLVIVVAAFLLATAAAQASSEQARCVIVSGITYCCWPQHMCRVCDSVKCFLLPASECPQSCP